MGTAEAVEFSLGDLGEFGKECFGPLCLSHFSFVLCPRGQLEKTN